jgi:Lon protease-like protein
MAGPFAPSEKQALLEASSLKERARVLITLAEMALAAGGESGPETRM